MRWVVELPAPSGGTAATVTVDADSWSSALKLARGGVTPKKFKCEFEGEGVVRVHDLDVRERFVVRPIKGIDKHASDEAVSAAPTPATTPEAPTAASVAPVAPVAPAASVTSVPPAAAPSAPETPVAAPASVSAAPAPEAPINGASSAAREASPALEVAAASHGMNGAAAPVTNGSSAHPDVSGGFTSISPLSEPLPVPRVLFERDQDPDPTNPLIYRERVFAVPPETSEAAAEQLARQAMAAVRRTLGSRGRGKYVMIAVFDHVFSSRPERQPLVVLRWKDWRGDPEVTYPSRSAPAAATAPVVIAPSVPAPAIAPTATVPAASIPAPTASTPAPSVPAPAPVVAAEPVVAQPAPVVATEPVAQPAPVAATEPAVTPTASIPAPVAATEPAASVSVSPTASESITPSLSISEDAATVSIPAPPASVVPVSIPAPAPSAPPPAVAASEPPGAAASSTSVDDEDDGHDGHDDAPSGEQPASSIRSSRRKRKKGHSPQTVRAVVPPPAETSSLTAVPVAAPVAPAAEPAAPVTEPAAPAVVAAPETPVAVTEPAADAPAVTAPATESVAVATVTETVTAAPAVAPAASMPPPAASMPPPPSETVANPSTPKFPRGTRRRGNDLVSDLFDGLMDLTFMADAKITCEFIAKLMREMFWVDASAVLLYDIDRDELVVAAVNGIEASIGGRQKLPKTPRGKAILKATNVVLENGGDPDGPIKGLPLGPTLLVPMLFHQRVFGLLELHRAPGDETFQSDEQDGLVYVASQLAEWLSLHARRAAFEEYADKH